MEKAEKYYHIINYGCQMNESDSEHFAGQLAALGYNETTELIQADVIVINTCCVRETAENRVYGKLGELKHLKSMHPGMIICVAGCMAQKEQDKLFARAPHIDIVLGTHNINNLGRIIASLDKRHVAAVDESIEDMALSTPAVRKSSFSAWVPIMYGCNNFCTYCIVPYVRGRERSRTVDAVTAEIAALGEKGFKEVTLLGQNVNSYGKDVPERPDFADLLTAADAIYGIERIRFMTSHPRDMNDRVIDAIRNSRHICRHIHLPIQSGSDRILKSMNRGYDTAIYRRLAGAIRQALPEASLTTDIIVGFPGETDDDFAETLAMVKEMRFDAAYTFIYSPRTGTPAATMAAQVPQVVKKQRLQQLMAVQNEISLENNERLVGTIAEVIVEGPSKHDGRIFTGRTDTNKIVLWEHHSENVGDLLNVKIEKAQTWVLKGSAEQ